MKIELLLTPAGHLRLDASGNADGWDLPDETANRLLDGFAAGSGEGLLALVREELPAGMPVAFQYFRKLSREFLTRLCHAPEPATVELDATFNSIRPDLPYFGFESLEAPPMRGTEYLSAETLLTLWTLLEQCIQTEFKSFKGSFGECLRKLNPAWKQVVMNILPNRSMIRICTKS